MLTPSMVRTSGPPPGPGTARMSARPSLLRSDAAGEARIVGEKAEQPGTVLAADDGDVGSTATVGAADDIGETIAVGVAGRHPDAAGKRRVEGEEALDE